LPVSEPLFRREEIDQKAEMVIITPLDSIENGDERMLLLSSTNAPIPLEEIELDAYALVDNGLEDITSPSKKILLLETIESNPKRRYTCPFLTY
jgi:hypothetical protein